MKHVSKLEFGNKFGCSAYRYYHNHQPSALKLVLVKQKKKVSRTSSGTYSVILHDKTASANFLDEVRVKSLKHCAFKRIVGKLKSRCLILSVKRLQDIIILAQYKKNNQCPSPEQE